MNINDYILKEIKALSPSDSVNDALNLCEHLPITHVPVVDNHTLIGCFAEDDIRTIEKKQTILNEYTHLLHHFNAHKKSSLLELIALFAKNNCNIIPVLDENQHYIGYYDLHDILDVFTDSPFMHNNNLTLVVAKSKLDFTMSEIAQIVESNKAKLLGLYVSKETMDNIEVTLKIHSEEMNEIIQTFRRYDYTVISELAGDMYLEELKDRANYFKKYLDI